MEKDYAIKVKQHSNGWVLNDDRVFGFDEGNEDKTSPVNYENALGQLLTGILIELGIDWCTAHIKPVEEEIAK